MIGAGVAAFIFGFILLALGCIVAFTARFFKSCPCQIMTKDGNIIYKWCNYIELKRPEVMQASCYQRCLYPKGRKLVIERVFINRNIIFNY